MICKPGKLLILLVMLLLPADFKASPVFGSQPNARVLRRKPIRQGYVLVFVESRSTPIEGVEEQVWWIRLEPYPSVASGR